MTFPLNPPKFVLRNLTEVSSVSMNFHVLYINKHLFQADVSVNKSTWFGNNDSETWHNLPPTVFSPHQPQQCPLSLLGSVASGLYTNSTAVVDHIRAEVLCCERCQDSANKRIRPLLSSLCNPLPVGLWCERDEAMRFMTATTTTTTTTNTASPLPEGCGLQQHRSRPELGWVC